MRHLILLSLALSLAAYADEGPMLTSVSVSGTSARTSADLGPGWKAFRCDVEVFFRTGTSSVVAVATDMPVPANTSRQVYISSGVEQRLAFITGGGSGTCRIYRLQVGPDGTPPDVMTVNGAAIAPSSVATTGDVTAGDDLISTDDLTVGDDAEVPTLKNPTSNADCSSNTGAVCVNDTGGLAIANGSGTTSATITAAGLISGDTPVTAGAFPSMFIGTGAAVVEGVDGLGPYQPSQLGRASRVGRVCCSCRVAGSGGSDGIFVSLMEDGSEVAATEIVGADNNACDDTARTRLCGSIAATLSQESIYSGQFKSTTDCAGNPTDCVCNFEILR